MNRRYIDIMIAIIFIVLLVFFFFLYKSSNECVANPLKYGAEKVSYEGNDLMCNCYFTDPSYAPFSFNKEGIKFQKQSP